MTKLTVIDDDPTGAQAEADVPLLLEWPPHALRDRERSGAVHLLTNSRALDDRAAYEVARGATVAALAEMPGRRVLLRGDSTLRGHLLAEYRAVRDVIFPQHDPPLVLIPALPAAGRVTVDGIHWLVRDGQRTPIADTEYARDRTFGFSHSRLLDWAQERSSGHFRAGDGREVRLDELRAPGGPSAIAAVLGELSNGRRPAVLAADAETLADLELIAAGLELAWGAGTEFIVRCGPAFVGVAAGTTAPGPVACPLAGRGVLVIVGSHVPATTRQLAALCECEPQALVEVDAVRLASPDPGPELERAAGAARQRLAAGGLAVVATSRETPVELLAPEPGMRIAAALAGVLARARDDADVIVSKGGITSAVNVRVGLGATEALVVGPLTDGIALWRVRRDDGVDANLIVFPGNVGHDSSLANLVDELRSA